MYWIIFSVLVVLILILLTAFILFVKESEDEAGNIFVIMGILSFILWCFIEWKTYEVGKPKDIKPKEISILKDKEVIILRYNGFQENYTTKKEYDAISDSAFVLEETIEYNIQGEANSRNYKMVIK
jgi:amino acid permease